MSNRFPYDGSVDITIAEQIIGGILLIICRWLHPPPKSTEKKEGPVVADVDGSRSHIIGAFIGARLPALRARAPLVRRTGAGVLFGQHGHVSQPHVAG